jgi:ParB-like chromosome segregation protein Spo0J
MPETSALIPNAKNSRTHSDQQIARIAGNIREIGFTNPVLIDRETPKRLRPKRRRCSPFSASS